MNPLVERLLANLLELREDIDRVAAATGRSHSDIDLLPVSKYATALETQALAEAMVAAGLEVRLAESRVQALVQKASELAGTGPEILWDLIGTLQSNKAGKALRVVDRIHSFDRESILIQLNSLAQAQEAQPGTTARTVAGLLQVNISAEGAKHGFDPDDLPAVLEMVAGLPGIRLLGFMGMAARNTDHDSARTAFAALRQLRDRLAPELPHLSMGMSRDYRGAILEGSTILRIGSLLFRSPPGSRPGEDTAAEA